MSSPRSRPASGRRSEEEAAPFAPLHIGARPAGLSRWEEGTIRASAGTEGSELKGTISTADIEAGAEKLVGCIKDIAEAVAGHTCSARTA